MNPDKSVNNIELIFTAKQTRLEKTVERKKKTNEHLAFILEGAVPCARKFMDAKGNHYYRPSIGRVVVQWKHYGIGYASAEEAIEVARDIIRTMQVQAFPNIIRVSELIPKQKFKLPGQRKFRTFESVVPCVDEWMIVYDGDQQMYVDPGATVEVKLNK